MIEEIAAEDEAVKKETEASRQDEKDQLKKEAASVLIEKRLANKEKRKKILIISLAFLFLVGFFFLAKNLSSDYFKELGINLPLPLFTFLIALLDGFNPCSFFILTLLLTLLISASYSKKRIYLVGYTFVFVVFIIYFLFMAAWLNIFKYIGFIDPLRYAIVALALIAGLINCKELFWFRKGVTLMIQEKHKAPLLRKINRMKEIIQTSSLPALILASLTLALFSSMIEIPCTAGFPLIYSSILAGKYASHSLASYLYLLFYNAIYVLPLAVLITILGYTFQGKQISKKQMAIIKFVSGLVMLLLGITLLVNPDLLV